MQFLTQVSLVAAVAAGLVPATGFAQSKTLTWQQVKDQFQATNPTLKAGRIGIEEARAQEITAYLRPNPDMTLTLDQVDPFTTNPYRPLGAVLPYISASYLHERQHKRELRLKVAPTRIMNRVSDCLSLRLPAFIRPPGALDEERTSPNVEPGCEKIVWIEDTLKSTLASIEPS